MEPAIVTAAPAVARSTAQRLPLELISLIFEFWSAELSQPGMVQYDFEGVAAPISRVCQAWRRAYYSGWLRTPIPHSLTLGPRGCARKLRVTEALLFWDLAEVLTFFHGPDGLHDHFVLKDVEFVSITYTDYWDITLANDATTALAWEALERFYKAHSQGLMPKLKWVELKVPFGGRCWHPQECFGAAAGFWNLLKLRGLQKFVVSTPHRGMIPSTMLRALREWTSRRQLHPWPQLKGLPNLLDLIPERHNRKVVRQQDFTREEDQFRFLDRMCYDRHGLKPNRERRRKWKAAQAKAKRRYPLAVRRRRQRRRVG
jgi:hypothetical protein